MRPDARADDGAAAGEAAYAVLAAYESGALEAWTGFDNRADAFLKKYIIQKDAAVVACEILTEAEVRARAAKRHALAQCAFQEMTRRARPWLSVEVRGGDSIRVVAGAYALPDSPDALIHQLRDAKELYVLELPPRRASSARAVRRAPSTDPVANLLRSCVCLEAFHWLGSADPERIKRAVEACPGPLWRVMVGGYDVSSWYIEQSPSSAASTTSTASSSTALPRSLVDGGPGHFRSVSEPSIPGAWLSEEPAPPTPTPSFAWLSEEPTPPTPTPSFALLHPLTQL